MEMSENVASVFRGFLNLPNLEKLRLTEAINEYFDSDQKETLRTAFEVAFPSVASDANRCVCCGREN